MRGPESRTHQDFVTGLHSQCQKNGPSTYFPDPTPNMRGRSGCSSLLVFSLGDENVADGVNWGGWSARSLFGVPYCVPEMASVARGSYYPRPGGRSPVGDEVVRHPPRCGSNSTRCTRDTIRLFSDSQDNRRPLQVKFRGGGTQLQHFRMARKFACFPCTQPPFTTAGLSPGYLASFSGAELRYDQKVNARTANRGTSQESDM